MQTDNKFNLKTIDITTKEWWDRVNGNTYFASRVSLNFGMEDEQTIYLPFQYGYGSQDEQETRNELQKLSYLPNEQHLSITRYTRENGIIYRHTKIDKCKQKDVKSWGIDPSK